MIPITLVIFSALILIICLLVTNHLITKTSRKQLDMSMRHMVLLRGLLGPGQHYTVLIDLNGDILDVAPSVRSINGMETKALINRPLDLLMQDIPDVSLPDMWHRIRNQEKSYPLHIRGELRNGTTFDRPVTVQPIHVNDAIVGFVLKDPNQEDGASEVRTEDTTSELAHANAKSEAIIESIGEGVIVTDKEGRITTLNKAAKELLQIDETAVGSPVSESMPLEDEHSAMVIPSAHPLMQSLTDKRRVMDRSLRIVRGDLSKISLAITASPVLVDGTVIGGVGVFRDITHEKDIDRAKTEFVSLASHQLRTPLTTISWYTELILGTDSGNLTDEQRNYLEVIYQGNRRMIDLVNALLNVSRLELGTLLIEPEPTDLKQLCNNVLRDVEPLIREKKHRVQFDFDESIESVKVDPRLMTMIVQNLLTNAIKYTPEEGFVSLEILKRYPDVMLRVSDTGFGIPVDQQDRIFSKLFRAENVTSRNTEGTGLGLYIVKSIMDHAGGRVWFESEENKGTTFYVTIPLEGMKSRSGSKSLT